MSTLFGLGFWGSSASIWMLKLLEINGINFAESPSMNKLVSQNKIINISTKLELHIRIAG